MGGDIAMPYANANPNARNLAKQFERENQRYIERFLSEIDQIKLLFRDTLDVLSIEAIVAKVADYIEVTEFKYYIGRLTECDVEMVMNKMQKMIGSVTSRTIKKCLTDLIEEWSVAISNPAEGELFEKAKKTQS